MAIYSADFETTTDVFSKEETHVWAGAFCNIEDYADDSKVCLFDCIEDFIYYIKYGFSNGDIIYFHNLKFDGSFIINALFRDNFIVHTEKYPIEKSYKRRCFSALISDMGIWYSIKIKFGRKLIEIRNSLCLIQGTVASIGDSFKTRKRKLDMDYDRKDGDYSAIITPQEKQYLMADVQIMAEALYYLIHDFGFTELTAGANAINDFIERFGGEEKFRAFFPKLEKDEDLFVRNAYKGGISYLLAQYMSKILGKGITVDKNSMYPSKMHSKSGNIYPYGKGKLFMGKPKKTRKYPLWVAECRVFLTLKEKKIPCVQIKKSTSFKENEWLETVGSYDDTTGEEIPVQITITNVDWELILECYDVHTVEWIGGYSYMGKPGMFDSFIDHWYEIKRNSTGAKKQCAKIVLNSFYGKFGTKLTGSSKIPEYENDTLKFKIGPVENHKGIYVPVAAFTTAYARADLVRSGNANYDRVVYFDTDSMHLTGWDDPVGVVLHDSDLDAWKVESKWDSAKFLRQKTYMEVEGDKVDIKCAGMPGDMKYRKYIGDDGKVHKMPRLTFDDFYIGAKWESGKLVARQVKGGVLLLDGPFQIADA